MQYFIQLGVLLIVFFISINCIREPMGIARAIVWWAKLVSGGVVRSPTTREAIDLMETDPTKYEKKFIQQLNVIRLTGWVGLIVSVVGSCILTMSK